MLAGIRTEENNGDKTDEMNDMLAVRKELSKDP